MCKAVYSWANIVRRWPTMPSQIVAYLEFNLLYRKFGKLTSLLGHCLGMRTMAKLARFLAYPAKTPFERGLAADTLAGFLGSRSKTL